MLFVRTLPPAGLAGLNSPFFFSHPNFIGLFLDFVHLGSFLQNLVQALTFTGTKQHNSIRFKGASCKQNIEK